MTLSRTSRSDTKLREPEGRRRSALGAALSFFLSLLSLSLSLSLSLGERDEHRHGNRHGPRHVARRLHVDGAHVLPWRDACAPAGRVCAPTPHGPFRRRSGDTAAHRSIVATRPGRVPKDAATHQRCTWQGAQAPAGYPEAIRKEPGATTRTRVTLSRTSRSDTKLSRVMKRLHSFSCLCPTLLLTETGARV